MSSAHDHRACVEQALTGAERYCQRRGLRLTALRRRVLELVWSGHKPVGAYAVLEQLGADGRKPAPPTVYRALNFLLGHALIHRIASLNAYVGCSHPGQRHAPQFFICARCGDALECDDNGISGAIGEDAARLGFRIEHPTIEIAGTCAHCLNDGGA